MFRFCRCFLSQLLILSILTLTCQSKPEYINKIIYIYYIHISWLSLSLFLLFLVITILLLMSQQQSTMSASLSFAISFRCRERHASPKHADIALRYSQLDRSAGRSKYGHCLRHANPFASGGCSRLSGYIECYLKHLKICNYSDLM